MSDAPVAADADASLTVMLWRQALATGPRVPRVQDLEAWIDHLGATGATTPLVHCVAVLRGIDTAPGADQAPGRWTIAVALDDLRVLAGRVGSAMTLTDRTPPWSGAPDNPAGIAADRRSHMPDDVDALARDLRSALAPDDTAGDRLLLCSLTALHDLHRRFPRIDYRDHRQASLPALIAAIALVVLVDFALRTRDLWAGPYGSATLMRAAAGLGATELGAYGDKIGLLVRSSRDIYDMARIAVAASIDPPTDAREAWICFLARNCGRVLFTEIVDDLGDIAASRPLAMLLHVAVDRIDVDVGLLWRVRDAALDNGDWLLAARAQRQVADARDQEGDELLILGTLHAMAGEVAAAAATFRELIARQWPGAAERLKALRAGTFETYAINRGYTSPADRQAIRLHRRGIAPGYPRVRGGRINAVDVG